MQPAAKAFLVLQLASIGGCGFTTQLTCDLDYQNVGSITKATIKRDGIGVLTPSSVTGHEADKQIFGDVLSTILAESLDDGEALSLAEFLNRINLAGLADTYAHSVEIYEISGIIGQDPIKRFGEAADVRFLAKLNLASIEQTQTERFGIAGIRVLSTNRTRIRLFLEIWDSHDGQIVWYANEDLSIASDRAAEENLSIRQAATQAIQQLVDSLLTEGQERSSEESSKFVCEMQS